METRTPVMTYTQTTLLIEYIPVDLLKMIDVFLTPYQSNRHNYPLLAHKGDLKGIQWVTKYRPSEKCPVTAMNNAALKGHLDVVEWLHKNRKEGCTSYAINTAALNGHLPIVKFLHKNRPKNGSLKIAVRFAAMNHRQNIIDYYHTTTK